jgi:hypothetical protein
MSEESDANFNERRCEKTLSEFKKNQDLEPLLELVLRSTKKEFRRPSFRKSHLQAQSESLSNMNLANLSIEESDQDMAKEILTL